MLFFICSDFGMTGADVRVGNYRYLLNQQTLCESNEPGALSQAMLKVMKKTLKRESLWKKDLEKL